jgi:hypothetical protein
MRERVELQIGLAALPLEEDPLVLDVRFPKWETKPRTWRLSLRVGKRDRTGLRHEATLQEVTTGLSESMDFADNQSHALLEPIQC